MRNINGMPHSTRDICIGFLYGKRRDKCLMLDASSVKPEIPEGGSGDEGWSSVPTKLRMAAGDGICHSTYHSLPIYYAVVYTEERRYELILNDRS